MICLTNSTTRRLESFARARKLHLSIVKSPDNARGLFFATGQDSKPWPRWISLGWTRAEAEQRIAYWDCPEAMPLV